MKIKNGARILWAIFIFLGLHFPANSYGEFNCRELFSLAKTEFTPVAQVPRLELISALSLIQKTESIEAAAIANSSNKYAQQIYTYVTETLREDWSHWLKDVEFSQRQKQSVFFKLSQTEIIAFLKTMDLAIDVSADSIKSNRGDVGRAVIKDFAGVDATGASFYRYITETRGDSWPDWLRKAGLSHRIKAQPNPFHKLSDSKIVKLLKALDKVILVSSEIIKVDHSEAGRKVIKELTGIDATAATLFSYITKLREEKWRDWLEKAKLSHRMDLNLNPFRNSTDQQIVELIQALDMVIFVNVAGIESNKSEVGKKVIKDLVGLDATPSQLYLYVTEIKKESWRDWLEKADREYRVQRETRKLTDEEIVKVIDALNKDHHPLNYNAMLVDTSVDSGLRIKQKTGVYITPSRLVVQVRNKESDKERLWDYWLVKAGLNPLEIRLFGQTPVYLLSAAIKGEFDANFNAFAKGGVGVEFSKDGVPTTVLVDNATPETILAREEFYRALKAAVEHLTPRQEQMFEMMLNYFETHSYSEVSGMGEYLKSQMTPPPADREWQNLLVEIGKHEELRDLLLDMF